MRQFLTPALIAFCVALLPAAVWAEEAKTDYPDVSIKDLKSAIEKNQVTVIDANGTDSYKSGHIPTRSISKPTPRKSRSSCPKTRTP